MKMIKDLVDKIDEELEGAKNYAEMYVEYKAKGDTAMASKFHSMAEDEIKHAMIIHDLATKTIEEVGKVFTAPPEMQEAWNKSHVAYVDKTAWIRKMMEI